MKLTSKVAPPKGFLDRVKRLLINPGGSITVGIHAAQGGAGKKAGKGAKGSAMSVLAVAIANEYGTDTIPARSFVRGYVDENESKIQAQVKSTLSRIVQGKLNRRVGLERLGQAWSGGMKARIAAGIAPANAASTIRRKGSSKPLIDTGQLRSSITYRVNGSGKREPLSKVAGKAGAKLSKLVSKGSKAAIRGVKRGAKRNARAVSRIGRRISRVGRNLKTVGRILRRSL